MSEIGKENTMTLIADSGSTKTDWCLLSEGTVLTRVGTQGINPVHQQDDVIAAILTDAASQLSPFIVAADRRELAEVVFYGAGCSPANVDHVETLLRSAFPTALKVSAQNDMMAAARALCGRQSGVACILGTGSNSCLYDGRQIVKNTPAMGYILGDEGSGAVLGRLFINGIFKGTLPASVRDAYLQETGLTLHAIINKVYRQPMANRFLASVSLFISKHISEPALRELVCENFRQFVRRNLLSYDCGDIPVSAVGSVADAYRPLLETVLREEGFRVGTILKSPMDGLIAYHSSSFC